MADLKMLKTHKLFEAFDQNRDGQIDASDINMMAKKIADVQANGQFESIRNELAKFFDDLILSLDLNLDGAITADEFADIPADVYRDFLIDFFRSVFEAFGISEDGMNLEKYKQFRSVCGNSETGIEDCFAKIDLDGNGNVTPQELVELVRQYATSDDDNSPANWLFGELN